MGETFKIGPRGLFHWHNVALKRNVGGSGGGNEDEHGQDVHKYMNEYVQYEGVEGEMRMSMTWMCINI